MFREARACAQLVVLCQVSRYPCYVQKVAYFAAECLYFPERDRRRSESNLSVLLHDNEQLCHLQHPVIRISRTTPRAATGHGMVKKCLVSVFSRRSAALALPPQPKWHALAQKTSINAANAMGAIGRPRGTDDSSHPFLIITAFFDFATFSQAMFPDISFSRYLHGRHN